MNTLPVIGTQPTAPTATCSGSGTQTISVVATGTGLTYSWRKGSVALSNGSVISGQGTSTLTLSSPTTADAGSYDVVVSGTCTPSVKSSSVTLTVNPLPDTPTVSPDPLILPFLPALCVNSNNLNYIAFSTSSTTSTPVKYAWSAVTNSNIVATQKGNINAPDSANRAIVSMALSGTGQQSIRLTAIFTKTGCQQTSAPIILNTASTAQETSTVIYNGNDFVCLNNNVDSYQWGYDDNNLIPHLYTTGEAPFLTAQNLTRPANDTTSKFVWVITKKGSCFSKTYCDKNSPYPRRPGLAVQPPVSQTKPIKITPNPVSNEATITWTYSSVADAVQVTLTDVAGKKVLVKSIPGGSITPGRAVLNVAALQRGVYFVSVLINTKKIITGKLIKE